MPPRGESINEARTIAELRSRELQNTPRTICGTCGMTVITYDEGYSNIRIIGRDQDDMPAQTRPPTPNIWHLNGPYARRRRWETAPVLKVS